MLENQYSQKWKDSTETKTEADLSVLKDTVFQEAQINHSLGIGGLFIIEDYNFAFDSGNGHKGMINLTGFQTL